jgi:hypothetical protein
MAATVTVNDVLDGHVVLDVECLDRIYLNGYVPSLQMGGQVVSFLTAQLGNPIPSPAILEKIGTAFRRAVASFAESNRVPSGALRQTRPQDRSDAVVSGSPGGDRAARGGRDWGGAGVRTGIHRHQEGARQGVWFSFAISQRRVTCYYFYVWLRHEVARCEWLRMGGRLMPET